MPRETISLYPYPRALLQAEVEGWIEKIDVGGFEIDCMALRAKMRQDYKAAMHTIAKPVGRLHWAATNDETAMPRKRKSMFVLFNYLKAQFGVSYNIAYNIPLSGFDSMCLPTIAVWSLWDRDISSKMADVLARSAPPENVVNFASYVAGRYPNAHKLQATLKLLGVPAG